MFADIATRQTNQGQNRIKFLNTVGRVTFRVLEDKAQKFSAHYVNRTTIQCLGDDCPVCETNKSIVSKNPNPKIYRNDPAYSPVIQRFAVNVLDKTLVKTCPQCGTENQVMAQVCVNTACNTFLSSVVPAPSNHVKVLQKGVKLFDQLNSLNDAVLTNLGDKIGLKNFDINLVSTGSGTSTTYTAIPSPSADAMNGLAVPPQEVPEPLFDLEKSILKLSRDEIVSLRNGVSIRDILIARSAVSEETTSVAPQPDSDIEAKARAELEKMLNDASS